jgi:hypothetical protein
VYIDRSHEHVVGGRGYDVALTTDPACWGELYGYYGYTPDAHPNYARPRFLDLFRGDPRGR